VVSGARAWVPEWSSERGERPATSGTSTGLLAPPGREAIFGPGYWLPRCDGFLAVTDDGRSGLVERVILRREGACRSLVVELRGRRRHVDVDRVVDLDSIARVVFIDLNEQGG
jgi:hypothetical protein